MSGPLLRRILRHAIERKRIHEELRSMQLQLIQAEKLESIGRLAAGVAHEVKNPLARILMGIEYLKETDEFGDPEAPVMLERMERAVHQADKIVRGLLDFSSNRRLEPVSVSLNALVEDALLLVKHEIKTRQVKVETDFADHLPSVHADRARLQQVLINVLMNALQAMEGREERVLSLRTYAELRHGDELESIVLDVEDTGGGIVPENATKVFDPFFTTKPTGVGTGLGLSVASNIIALHGGDISLSNRAQGGACARISLRATAALDADEVS